MGQRDDPKRGVHVKRIMAVVFLGALSWQISPIAQVDAKWQSSWPAFLAVLGPEIGPNPVNPGYRQFYDKAVNWEGVLGAIGSDEKTRIRIDMTPSKTHGHEVNVQLFPKAGDFAKWKAVALGSKVRFRATIEDSFSILVMSVGGPGGTPVAAVMVKDGELVGR